MMTKNRIFNYGSDRLTIQESLNLASRKSKGFISKEIKNQIDVNKQAVEHIVAKGEIVYGINTGFGPLCSTVISKNETKKLQDNILRSHSVGVGEPVSNEISRLMLVLKIHALCQGYSGISFKTVERMLWHLKSDVIPVVPSQGSVGASGDLVPLAHLFLPLIGLGYVSHDGQIKETSTILKKENLKPLILGPKEGLALINGTQFMVAHGIIALERLHNCLDSADIIGAMTLEALLGSAKPFRAELHDLRPHLGCRYVAHRLKKLLKDSEMVASHSNCGRVQDPYSIRCMPQVHGASRNAWLHMKEMIDIEMNSVTDNPIILDEENSISGGNFHGQPIALPLDYTSLAACELGNISDRRTYLLLEGGHNGLPKLLMKDIGINSGFMIPQYTSAALVSENKSMCFPASADSIPTSLGQEDHVSMGSISARKLNRILDNLENILAVELLCAAQAFDFRRPMKSSKILEACHERIRSEICHAEADRVFSKDLEIACKLIRDKSLVKTAVEAATREKINLRGDCGKSFTLD